MYIVCVCVCTGRKSCYSTVNVVAKLWAGRSGFRFLDGARDFSLPKTSRGPSRLYTVGTRIIYPWGIAARAWSWPVPSSTKVKNVWSYTYTPAFMAWRGITYVHTHTHTLTHSLTNYWLQYFHSFCLCTRLLVLKLKWRNRIPVQQWWWTVTKNCACLYHRNFRDASFYSEWFAAVLRRKVTCRMVIWWLTMWSVSPNFKM